MIPKSLLSHRSLVMVAAAAAVVAWFWYGDPSGGLQLQEQLRTLLGGLTAIGLAYLARKAIMPGDAKEAWGAAMAGCLPSAILVLAMAILTGMLFLGFIPRALAAPLPGNAPRDLPVLMEEIGARWPGMPMPSMLGALVEQESGWKPGATLKTTREEGAGYGQFTRAYRADGSLRFDALAEVIRLDPSLKGWAWTDRYNPRMQLRAVTVKVRDCHRRLSRLADDDYNALAMCDAAYNGGEGGLMAERRLCAAVGGCDPGQWFANVELHSGKSRTKWQGYGASAYDINRTHARNVMVVRRGKYVGVMGA